MNGASKNKIIQATNKITYGLYVLTAASKDGTKINGQCANAVMQVTVSPIRIVIAINNKNYTTELVKESGEFTLNVLKKDQFELVSRFGMQSGRTVNKFANQKSHKCCINAPVLDDTLAYLECRVVPSMILDAGTHTLFVADVIDGEVLAEGEPFVYDYYRSKKLSTGTASPGGKTN
jgi:flavin reductase (DIM6/NTAB) family NADH-FMN oxidoreductase RutF